MTSPRLVPATQNVDGDEISVYFNPSLYRQAPNFEPQKGDVIQVTFPRSGTHWVQQIIQLILHKGKSASSFVEFTEKAPFIEIQGIKTTDSPRLLRTHLPVGKIRFNSMAKYVYVARNPWDCCVSCYHLVHEAPAFNFSAGTFEHFLDAFLEGRFGFGDYFEHVHLGYKLKDEPNVFFVTYEELHSNKAGVILRLAYFLGEEYRRTLEENEDVFRNVLKKSTVDFMKGFMRPSSEELNRALSRNPELPEELKNISESKARETQINILRKGEPGGWKQYFKTETTKKMQDAIDEKIKRYGVPNIWEPY
ncbi:unnamed protein product [Ixodes hexagonus]